MKSKTRHQQKNNCFRSNFDNHVAKIANKTFESNLTYPNQINFQITF
jgi:hypothetical protein